MTTRLAPFPTSGKADEIDADFGKSFTNLSMITDDHARKPERDIKPLNI